MYKLWSFLLAMILSGSTVNLPATFQQGQIPGSVEANNSLSKARNNRASQGQPTANYGIVKPDQRALQENTKAIQIEVTQLYELASSLKAEVDHTDTTKILPASLSKKARQIEKLAKEIKSRSKS